MWYEYVIIFSLLLVSIIFLVRYFRKKFTTNECDSGCATCIYKDSTCHPSDQH
jgi:hypothetical protein